MVYASNYGKIFEFVSNNNIMKENDAISILEKAVKIASLSAELIGCYFDGSHLVPSLNGIGITHIKCEFTSAVINQGIEIRKVSLLKANRKRIQPKKVTDEKLADYIISNSRVKIEGVHGRATNHGNGYTLTVFDVDPIEAKEVLKNFCEIKNQDKSNDKAISTYKLTMFDEVANVLVTLGIADEFLEKTDTIKDGEIWEKHLIELI